MPKIYSRAIAAVTCLLGAPASVLSDALIVSASYSVTTEVHVTASMVSHVIRGNLSLCS